jgi:hypothetical protein
MATLFQNEQWLANEKWDRSEGARAHLQNFPRHDGQRSSAKALQLLAGHLNRLPILRRSGSA